MPADSRETILRRIREALAVKAPARHADHDCACDHSSEADAPSGGAKQWLPPVPKDRPGIIALFEKNSADLKTEVFRCPDFATATATLTALARDNGWKSVATHEFAGKAAVESLGLPVLRTDAPYATADLERCDAGISGCDCLVAQTGGIMVTSASAGGRALSVLPPHHIVMASCDQVVGDLSDAFRLASMKYKQIPAFLSFITGPSRTGDIERILVLGAHGPKRLTVILVGE